MNLKVLYNLFLHDFYPLFVKFNSVIYCLYIMFSVNMLYIHLKIWTSWETSTVVLKEFFQNKDRIN